MAAYEMMRNQLMYWYSDNLVEPMLVSEGAVVDAGRDGTSEKSKKAH